MIGLHVDVADLTALGAEFGASEAQIRAAANRALGRTVRAVRTRARTSLRLQMGLAAAKYLKRRISAVRARGAGGLGTAEVWIGRNDMLPEAFRGRPRQGARGVTVRGDLFEGAFLARDTNGVVRVFERVGRARLPIERVTVPVGDEMSEILEDQVFDEVAGIFWKNFRAELRARTIYGVGGR